MVRVFVMSNLSSPLGSASSTATVRPKLPKNLSLRAYVQRFQDLPAPEERDLHGRFRAEFVGPWWLRLSAGPSVSLAGLRDWWGKELSGFGLAQNLVRKQGKVVPTLPMQLGLGPSKVDGKVCAVLSYGPESPFPWPRLIDELRVLGPRELLGMSVVDLPGLRGHAFPFLLVREGAGATS